MSSTSAPTTFSDLYTDLLNRARQDTSSSATATQAKRYINIALYDMHIGFSERFPWAERRGVLVTNPNYTTGTVSAAGSPISLSGSGTAWDTYNSYGMKNMRAGGKIRFAGGDEVYEVSTVSSDTVAALSSNEPALLETVSGASYSYFEDEYALASDFLRPIDQTRFSSGGIPITLVGRSEFRVMFPQNHTPGKPFAGTILDLAFSGGTTPVRKLRLAPPPDTAYQIRYEYVTSNLAVSSSGTAQAQLSADTDEPIIPVRYRHLLVLHGLYHWYRDKKNDTRAQEARAEYTDLLLRVAADGEIGSQRTSIAPSVSSYAGRARRPWGGISSGVGSGDAFDRLYRGVGRWR